MTDATDDPFEGTDEAPISDGGAVMAAPSRRSMWIGALKSVAIPSLVGFAPIAVWLLVGFEPAVMLTMAALVTIFTSLALGVGDA
jgi:hypothetical protein